MVPRQHAHLAADHMSADDILRYQMTARQVERMLPSGSVTTTLTPAQLDYLAAKLGDDESPVARGLRALLDLDERLDTANPQVSASS
ncbi:hypothetical protein [Actinacidiphila sp. ITFR-21]|uniref:hypothetical protein n=1 Tax=Actinacidiphila sp. ITFR-21 TaxID=3075199 RepID=UPI00288AAFEC|nr:hypothetical protein [Streptomyces sp. ITFR-21]WNI17695.1 hypothetical protein RLT57_20610 [Streptomyces sp. ITFR-21]WNI17835.1 hypothetical protein RLT57_21325 [Streptomyces sp. ITFR-21]